MLGTARHVQPCADEVGLLAHAGQPVMTRLRRIQIEPHARERADVVSMDLQMPRLSGIAATRAITSEQPATQAVVLTPFDTDEERILALIAEGESTREIAKTVFLAEGTVKNYVSRIMEELHARTRTELAVKAPRVK